mgnify:CR=1 FL=1
MPLRAGEKNIGRNIAIELEHGKPKKQAVAIALNVAGKSKPKYRNSSDGKMKA